MTGAGLHTVDGERACFLFFFFSSSMPLANGPAECALCNEQKWMKIYLIETVASRERWKDRKKGREVERERREFVPVVGTPNIHALHCMISRFCVRDSEWPIRLFVLNGRRSHPTQTYSKLHAIQSVFLFTLFFLYIHSWKLSCAIRAHDIFRRLWFNDHDVIDGHHHNRACIYFIIYGFRSNDLGPLTLFHWPLFLSFFPFFFCLFFSAGSSHSANSQIECVVISFHMLCGAISRLPSDTAKHRAIGNSR